MRRTIHPFSLVLIGLLVASVVGATTLTKLSEEAMTDAAAVIVEGHCTALTGQWVGKTLYTLATITVDDALKGNPGQELTLVIPGGVDLDREVPIAFTVPGAPVVQEGENLLLFLAPDGAVGGGYAAVGFNQGKLSVVTAPDGKRMAIAADGASSSLEALKQRIRRHLLKK